MAQSLYGSKPILMTHFYFAPKETLVFKKGNFGEHPRRKRVFEDQKHKTAKREIVPLSDFFVQPSQKWLPGIRSPLDQTEIWSAYS